MDYIDSKDLFNKLEKSRESNFKLLKLLLNNEKYESCFLDQNLIEKEIEILETKFNVLLPPQISLYIYFLQVVAKTQGKFTLITSVNDQALEIKHNLFQDMQVEQFVEFVDQYQNFIENL